MFLTGKPGIPVPVDIVPVLDPTRKTSTRTSTRTPLPVKTTFRVPRNGGCLGWKWHNFVIFECISTKLNGGKVYIWFLDSCVKFHAKIFTIAEISTKVVGGATFYVHPVIVPSVDMFACSQGYTIPEGDMLMLSPYWCHRNPTLFPEPELFQPVCVFYRVQCTFTFIVL